MFKAFIERMRAYWVSLPVSTQAEISSVIRTFITGFIGTAAAMIVSPNNTADLATLALVFSTSLRSASKLVVKTTAEQVIKKLQDEQPKQ